jgi:chromosome segregation ATPase
MKTPTHLAALRTAEQKHDDARARLQHLRVERSTLEQRLRDLQENVDRALYEAGRSGTAANVDELRQDEEKTRQRHQDVTGLERGAEAATRQAFDAIQSVLAEHYEAFAGDLKARARELLAERVQLAERQARLEEQLHQHAADWERLERARSGDHRLAHLKHDPMTGDLLLGAQDLEPMTSAPTMVGTVA